MTSRDALPPEDAGHRDLGGSHVAVAADADALAVVGSDEQGRLVQVAALVAPGEE